MSDPPAKAAEIRVALPADQHEAFDDALAEAADAALDANDPEILLAFRREWWAKVQASEPMRGPLLDEQPADPEMKGFLA